MIGLAIFKSEGKVLLKGEQVGCFDFRVLMMNHGEFYC